VSIAVRSCFARDQGGGARRAGTAGNAHIFLRTDLRLVLAKIAFRSGHESHAAYEAAIEAAIANVTPFCPEIRSPEFVAEIAWLAGASLLVRFGAP
jgi:hypothetical protein